MFWDIEADYVQGFKSHRRGGPGFESQEVAKSERVRDRTPLRHGGAAEWERVTGGQLGPIAGLGSNQRLWRHKVTTGGSALVWRMGKVP